MKFKLDENLPLRLAESLQAMGHSVDTVVSEGLSGEPDARIWQAAQSEGRVLITQDLDFSDIRHYALGTHAGILLVRLHNPGREALLQRVMEVFKVIVPETLAASFAVVTDTKIRIHPPPEP